MNPQTISKISDQIGYLVLNETGAIISSGGELENNEKTAEAIFNLLSITDKIEGVTNPGEGFNKISVCFKDFCYVISMSNRKIHVVQRKFTPTESQQATPCAEPHLIDLQVPTNNSINA
ncbi:UNVERIFIED_CONTAM: hypothetical protein PYX00_002160 [Menopon gallinae]|uniref:Late endosomal/lysosomal adaptor and MAPK and MTOR activator 4 n=1 Tax=Menopon gallinae TaxID=328185 RepID=A0AAW2IGM6_9NEOP